jgi:DNA-binding IclR family transcriptional regulator
MEQSRNSRPLKARLSSVANSILKLAKSTVHRLAATLTAARFLEQNGETGKYRLGLALFELGSLVRARMDVADAARQKLRELLETTGETVQLGIIDHQSVLYIYEMESRRAIRMAAAVGARAPLHCTAVGKVLLASQPEDYVKQVLELGLKAYTPKTITKNEELLEAACARSPARCVTIWVRSSPPSASPRRCSA